MLQKGSFTKLTLLILGVGLFATAAYAAHDLASYAILEPSDDYVEADSSIIPKLGIANLGDEVETGFSVEFMVIDEEEGDTVFADTEIVDYIMPYPDSIEVEFDEWLPEGICRDMDEGGPFVEYKLIGLVCLHEVGPGEFDSCPENDTVRGEVTCLLSHDAGVTDIVISPEPDEPPNHYNPGTPITITATVENFGYHQEHDVPVRCEIRDRSYGVHDSLIYLNIQLVSIIDWRGNPYENPYIVDVTFPVWTYPSGVMWFCVECRTEMPGDLCPDDDFEGSPFIDIIKETDALPDCFKLEVVGRTVSHECQVSFALPHEARVTLGVFDIDGRLVKNLGNNVSKPGYYNRTWDCRDAQGRKVATGVYLIRMQADEFKAVRKLVVVN